MIKLNQARRAPEADQGLEAEAEAPDITGGQNLDSQGRDRGTDIDVIEKDLTQEDAILDQDLVQDLVLLLVKALDTKEKGNGLVHPLGFVKKGPKATVPKLLKMISVPLPPRPPTMTIER